MAKSILVCSCGAQKSLEEGQPFKHNGTYHIWCDGCKSHRYFQKVTFLRECFYCGEETVEAVPRTDQYGEHTGRYIYECFNCGACEGDQGKRKRKQ